MPTRTQVTSKTNLETKELIKSFKQFKEIPEESENPISLDYCDPHDLTKIQIHQPNLSIIHLNISLASYTNEQKLFLNLCKTNFHIICILENRIFKNNFPNMNQKKPHYNTEHTLTESKAGRIYISKKVSYRISSDLNIYSSFEVA